MTSLEESLGHLASDDRILGESAVLIAMLKKVRHWSQRIGRSTYKTYCWTSGGKPTCQPVGVKSSEIRQLVAVAIGASTNCLE